MLGIPAIIYTLSSQVTKDESEPFYSAFFVSSSVMDSTRELPVGIRQ
jgi:hypothetical protein